MRSLIQREVVVIVGAACTTYINNPEKGTLSICVGSSCQTYNSFQAQFADAYNQYLDAISLKFNITSFNMSDLATFTDVDFNNVIICDDDSIVA